MTLNVTQGKCSAIIRDSILVSLEPTVDFATNIDPLPNVLSVAEAKLVEFYPIVDIADRYVWKFTAVDSLIDALPNSQSYLYTAVGDYDVSLTAYNNGCVSISPVRRISLVDEGVIYTPTVFSPNGDNIYDFFKPTVVGVPSYKMSLFSRWGDLIYTGTEADKGWDGTVKSLIAPDGVYVCIISGVTYGGKKINYSGLVTVVK